MNSDTNYSNDDLGAFRVARTVRAAGRLGRMNDLPAPGPALDELAGYLSQEARSWYLTPERTSWGQVYAPGQRERIDEEVLGFLLDA